MAKKEEVQTEESVDAPRRVKYWECVECKAQIPTYQMDLQPKICTTCGIGKLKAIY